MVRIRCDASGKTLQVKNVVPGQSIRCPACGGSHVVPAETESTVANPFEAAASPPPPPPPLGSSAAAPPALPPRSGASTRYGIDRGVCIFHPGVNAVAKCRRCRKALCETCAFRAAGSVFCADCASKPDPEKSKASSTRGMWSLICAGGAILLFMISIIVSIAASGDQGAETFSGCILFISLGIAITGLVLGIISKSRSSKRPVTGLIGLILNGLIVGLWALIIVLAMVMVVVVGT